LELEFACFLPPPPPRRWLWGGIGTWRAAGRATYPILEDCAYFVYATRCLEEEKSMIKKETKS
jgi:hypothetical protein